MQVKTKKLSVGYNKKSLISDIDLGVEKGKIVTLIGPNGSGKSTILKTITRHLEKIGGVIVLDQRNIEKWSNKELAKRMSVMLTERVAPELMTCHEVVALGRYPYTNAFGKLTPEDEAIVMDSLRLVRAEDLAYRLFTQISDGQRQRVMLARALCQQPEVLVLDEPTSYLDIRHKIELLDILQTLASQKQVAVLLSLHEIDLAAKISDWLICVKGDRIKVAGPPDEVFLDEKMCELYNLQTGSYNTLFGSVELTQPKGEPEAFILAGNSMGIPLFRLMQKYGLPFSTGILFENDADSQVARVLSDHVVMAPAFSSINDAHIAQAKQFIDQAPVFVHSGTPIREQNARYIELLEYAKSVKKPVLSRESFIRKLGSGNRKEMT
ncbi:MAG TPA: ABC transporter ATP-binding protein [Clostridiales bacterium]|jgi:iron complex transport system ATP-binding protein|nr:ABC transporter ATP-binding protein [Clostridiales bacterium]